MWIKTYGRLFQNLVNAVADIPIGIYRTVNVEEQKTVAIEIEDVDDENEEKKSLLTENEKGNVQEMVKQRMKSLQLNVMQYSKINITKYIHSFRRYPGYEKENLLRHH